MEAFSEAEGTSRVDLPNVLVVDDMVAGDGKGMTSMLSSIREVVGLPGEMGNSCEGPRVRGVGVVRLAEGKPSALVYIW